MTASKPGVLRAGQEAGQRFPSLLVAGVDAHALAVQKARLHGDQPIGVLLVGHVILTIGPALDGVGSASALDVLVLDEPGPAEEGGELMELLAGPRLGLGIMTLGAL